MSGSVRAPTGNIERWLISDKDTGKIYGVVWDMYWFDARSRAAAFYTGGIIGRLEVSWDPPSLREKETGEYLSGREIAQLRGVKLMALVDVQQFPPRAA
jgi:hypothetical protein